MNTALEHPLVAGYLRTLDGALASLEPGAAAELCEQIKAHIVEALPPGASDDMVAAVLAALGPPATVAAEAGPPWPQTSYARQSLWRRAASRTRRTPLRAWLIIVPLALAVCLAAGTLIFWENQPSLGFYSGSYVWWYPADRARDVTTQAAGAIQDTVPLRPGQLQGFAVWIYNPSDVTQRILGPQDPISIGAPVPPQIAVATTWNLGGNDAHAVRYQIGGAIPPHSYRWVRVLWRSYRCYLNAVGSSQGSNVLTVRVRLGWITRTEDIHCRPSSPSARRAPTCRRRTARRATISRRLDLQRRPPRRQRPHCGRLACRETSDDQGILALTAPGRRADQPDRARRRQPAQPQTTPIRTAGVRASLRLRTDHLV